MIPSLRRRRPGAGGRANAEELMSEIHSLSAINRQHRDPEIERRIIALRHRAGQALVGANGARPEHAEPSFDRLPAGKAIPEVEPSELDPGLLRAAILRHGCLLVRGLVEGSEALRLAEEIELALEERRVSAETGDGGGAYYAEFDPGPPTDLAGERNWVNDAGIWAADAPRVTFDMLEALERVGLGKLISGYLGERAALSVQKCTLRKVTPDAGSQWHQDGAFLGDVRALNLWLSLSRCGDEAPGLDVVPRRLEEIVPTGTDGALFNWSVSPQLAEEAAGDLDIQRPIFEPGDALFFDEMLLHATAADPSMPRPRYAVESWFFGLSGFPREYLPLAV